MEDKKGARADGGRRYQREGPATKKDLDLAILTVIVRCMYVYMYVCMHVCMYTVFMCKYNYVFIQVIKRLHRHTLCKHPGSLLRFAMLHKLS